MKLNFIFKTSLLAVSALLIGNITVAQFSGNFAPANWTLTLTNSNGSVNTAGAPASIVISGSDNAPGPSPADTRYTISAPSHGIVTASWSYHTDDVDGPAFDPAYYVRNGVVIQVTNSGGADDQSGTIAFSVLAGQTFGFGVIATDDALGRAHLTISNFVFTNISCGKNGDKIQICHKPGEHNAKTLCIGLDGLADHLGHGDYVGPCGSPITNSPLESARPVEGINESIPVRAKVDVFTNPSSSQFTLKLTGNPGESITVRVLDQTGRLIEKKENLATGVVLQIGKNYQPGMYIAEMIQGSQRRTVKLIKLNN